MFAKREARRGPIVVLMSDEEEVRMMRNDKYRKRVVLRALRRVTDAIDEVKRALAPSADGKRAVPDTRAQRNPGRSAAA